MKIQKRGEISKPYLLYLEFFNNRVPNTQHYENIARIYNTIYAVLFTWFSFICSQDVVTENIIWVFLENLEIRWYTYLYKTSTDSFGGPALPSEIVENFCFEQKKIPKTGFFAAAVKIFGTEEKTNRYVKFWLENI